MENERNKLHAESPSLLDKEIKRELVDLLNMDDIQYENIHLFENGVHLYSFKHVLYTYILSLQDTVSPSAILGSFKLFIHGILYEIECDLTVPLHMPYNYPESVMSSKNIDLCTLHFS